MNPERLKTIVKAADQLMEQKARELVETFFVTTFYQSWDTAKKCAVKSLESSIEWVKGVHAYYKETQLTVLTIQNMIEVVKDLKPGDYGQKKTNDPGGDTRSPGPWQRLKNFTL